MNRLQERPFNTLVTPPSYLGFNRGSHKPSAAAPGDDPSRHESLNPIRLLLVDDDRLSRIMTANLLKASHIEVAQAENGLDALMQCQARAFDIVLTDLRMPIMDGETLAFRLRHFETENRRLPCRIVVLAASLGAPTNTLLANGTVDAALEKPALIGDVLKAVLG